MIIMPMIITMVMIMMMMTWNDEENDDDIVTWLQLSLMAGALGFLWIFFCRRRLGPTWHCAYFQFENKRGKVVFIVELSFQFPWYCSSLCHEYSEKLKQSLYNGLASLFAGEIVRCYESWKIVYLHNSRSTNWRNKSTIFSWKK